MAGLRDKAAGATPVANSFRTSTSSTLASTLSAAPSEAPSIEQSSPTTSIATLSSLPSITSVESASTITPGVTSSSRRRFHVKSPPPLRGRSGGGVPAAAPTAVAAVPTARGLFQSRKGGSSPATLQQQQQTAPRMELPVLPALEDTGFDLLPLLLTDTGSIDTNNFFKSTADPVASSATTTSTLTPSSTAHFLTSRSSQIEDLHHPLHHRHQQSYQPYSSTATAAAPTTAIDSNGNVIRQDSIQPLASTVPGYFIHTQPGESTNHVNSKQHQEPHRSPHQRPALGPRTFTSTSTSFEQLPPVLSSSSIVAPSMPHPPHSQSSTTQANDKLSPPRRFVIRKPSTSNLPTSTTGSVGGSLSSSKAPSLARSPMSDESSSLYIHEQSHDHLKRQPFQQKPQQQNPSDTPNYHPSISNLNTAVVANASRKKEATKATPEVTFVVPLSKSGAAIASRTDPKPSGSLFRKNSKRGAGRAVATTTNAAGGTSGIGAASVTTRQHRGMEPSITGSPSSPSSPNQLDTPLLLAHSPSSSPSSLRTRLSRLFRPHAKYDKPDPQKRALDPHQQHQQQRQVKTKAPLSPSRQISQGLSSATPGSASVPAGVGMTNGAQKPKTIPTPGAEDNVSSHASSSLPRPQQPHPQQQQQQTPPPPSSLPRAVGRTIPPEKKQVDQQRRSGDPRQQQPLLQQELSTPSPSSSSEQHTNGKPLIIESTQQTQQEQLQHRQEVQLHHSSSTPKLPTEKAELARLGSNETRKESTEHTVAPSSTPITAEQSTASRTTTRKVSSIPRPSTLLSENVASAASAAMTAASSVVSSGPETVATARPPGAPSLAAAQLPIMMSKEPDSMVSIPSTHMQDPPSSSSFLSMPTSPPLGFAAGEDISQDTPTQCASGSPHRNDRSSSTPRQRRVSSVSSSNSIRQVGTYGGMGTLASPARKANPYHTGALARFSPGTTNATILGLPRRKSTSSPVNGTIVALQEAASMTPPVPPLPSLPTTQSLPHFPTALQAPTPRPLPISASSSMLNMTLQQQEYTDNNKDPFQQSVMSEPVATFMFDEEYSVEKDSINSSAQSTPTLARPNPPYNNNSSLMSATPSPPSRVLLPLSSSELRAPAVDDFMTTRSSVAYELGRQQTAIANALDSSELFGDEEFARRNEGVVITEYASDEHDDEDNDDDDNDEEEDDDEEENVTETEDDAKGPRTSVDTLRSSVPGSHTQDIDTATDSSARQQHRSSYVSAAPSGLSSSRRSMDTSVSPQSPQTLSSPPPRQRLTIHPPAMLSRQWSESSYDPCAPMRWDELMEMDPNSKGPLWLSNRGLGQISNEFFDGLRNLRELYLDHNDIKVVPDSLLKLTKLDVLDLSWNSLSSFHAAFKLKKLKNLRRLNLDHNLLTDISPLYKLKSLRELRLNHNLVQYLAMSIQHLTKLKVLTVESNQIAMLPETMGRLTNLCELRLSDNNLRALPESIGSIRTLQVLALRSNLLEKLPESWKDMESLTTLDLACNRLTSLPPDIVRLPKLTQLDLHDNQLQALPEKIGQLSNLVVLQLCNNHLRELPRDIGRLRELHDLVLSFNRLEYLPDEIGKLTKLQELKWDNNQLKELPKTIQKLSQIRRIHLQGCRLQQLPVALGVVFKDLVYLDISDNRLEVLPALDQMYRLEELYISHNLIRDLGTSALYLAGTSTSGTVSTTIGAVVAAAAAGGGGSSSINGSIQSSASNTLTSTATGSLSMSTAVNEAPTTTSQDGTLSSTTGTTGGGPGLAGILAAANISSSGGSGASGGHHRSSIGAGVTASKLSDLKRLRVLEAHHNQIRILTNKIKMLRGLEVLNLGHNLLNDLPKEVGDLTLLKTLVLEGNPIHSLPSTLSRLMGSLEIFKIGDWPEHGFEISREQMPVNMKINILQSAMPRQIERTLLWRMHEAILKRAHELASQKDHYPNGYEPRLSTERFRYRNSGLIAKPVAGTTTLALASSTMHSMQRQLLGESDNDLLSSPAGATMMSDKSSKPSGLPLQLLPKKAHHMGIAQGLAIATKHIMQGRGFAVPAVSQDVKSQYGLLNSHCPRFDDNQSQHLSSYHAGGESSPTSSAFSTDSHASLASTIRHRPDASGRRYSKESNSEYDLEVAMVNMEGINPNVTTRCSQAPPQVTHLQIPSPSSSILGYRGSASEILTMSPLSEVAPTSGVDSPSIRLSAPSNPILRARRSAQQLGRSSRGSSSSAAGKLLRPRSMYAPMAVGQTNEEDEIMLRSQKPVIGYALQHHKAAMSNIDLSHPSRPMSAACLADSNRPRTSYESQNLSSLYLNADAMTGLGLGTEPGTAGSVITHNNGPITTTSSRLEVPEVMTAGSAVLGHRSGSKGSGDLSDLKKSLAIKSSPALTSSSLHPLMMLSSPTNTTSGSNVKGVAAAAAAAAAHAAAMPVSVLRSQTPNPTSSMSMDSMTSGSGALSRTNGSSTGNNNVNSSNPLSRLVGSKVFGRPQSPSPSTAPPLPRSSSLQRSPSSSAALPARSETPSALPWLRLKTSVPAPPTVTNGSLYVSSSPLMDTPSSKSSNQPTLKRANSSSVKISASAILSGLTSGAVTNNGANGASGGTLAGLNVSTPPPILLDYELDASSSLDLPSQFYYNPGGPVEGDVDLDPSTETVTQRRRHYDHDVDGDDLDEEGDRLIDDEYDIEHSSVDPYAPTARSAIYAHSPIDDEYTLPSGPDPVLKIAVLKGVYDQILYNFENPHLRRHHTTGTQDSYLSSEDGSVVGIGGQDGHHSHRGSKKGSDRFKLFRFLNPLNGNNGSQHQQQHHLSSLSQLRGSKDDSESHHHSLFQHPQQHYSSVVHTTTL